MSTTAEHAPTLEYLTDAAHLLQTTAPETSAHLMSQRGNLMWQHDMTISETQRQNVCGACGNIMIPGHSSALKLDARRARHATKKTEPRRVKGLTKVIQCGRCNKSTKTRIDPVPRNKVNKSKAGPDLATPTRPTPTNSDASTAPKPATAQSNASSKKRAKSRKAGLQALLSGQQQQKSNPLSLADFMKK